MLWKAGTSVVLTLALGMSAIAPILTPGQAKAQLFPSESQQQRRPLLFNDRVAIPINTVIPVEYAEKDKILVTKEETMPLTLTVAANVRDTRDRLLIPRGSEIIGELRPDGEGQRFFAQSLKVGENEQYDFNGSSEIVTRTETIDQGADTGAILQNAAIGAAASALLSTIFGDGPGIGQVLGGAGIGALGGLIFGRKQAELISIDPDQDLDTVIRSELIVKVQNPGDLQAR
ncbi:MAG: hypothetical protein ACLFV6_17820 [Spirulinaceae cyanobacterium]